MPSPDFSNDMMPRRWRDASFELKAMICYHLAIMFLFATGLVPVPYEIAIAGGLVALFALASLYRRRRAGWHLQTLRPMNFVSALGTLAVAAIFAFATTSSARRDDPHMAAWFLGIAGLGLFGVLQTLKLVTTTEREFQAQIASADMRNPAPTVIADIAPGEPRWHRIVRGLFQTAGLAIWLCFAAFFYLDGLAMSQGPLKPTAALTAPITEKGATRYVTPERAALIAMLLRIGMFGIPALLLGGPLLQIFAKVKIFPGGIRFMGRSLS